MKRANLNCISVSRIAYRAIVVLAVLWAICLAGQAGFAAERVLPAGESLKDARLQPPKDLNGYFPLAVPANLSEWEARAKFVRQQALVSLGLWPMPTKTPMNPRVHGKVERDGYTVERVYLESFPGHYVTGSLYRPTGKKGPFPAVLCPHGHWSNGRFTDAGEDGVKQAIAEGGEKFTIGGRSPLQARCVHLARLGCVVFHYDMVGYADSVQIPFDVSHRYGKPRPQMEGKTNWGYFSPQAEMRMQSIMGLQTYNSIRALDFVCELPDVDSTRIGVTGASGGGTQTFTLCAVDPRPTAAFPAVMVSTAMQGGCTCENASYFRVNTGNIEIAGLFAPKPMAMSGANDWTVQIQTKGLPELKSLYRLFNAEDNVMAASFNYFGHNYNAVSRSVMYAWFNKHLRLGADPDALIERDYQPLSIDEMTVWNSEHPKPDSSEDYERSLSKYIADDSDRLIAALSPKDLQGVDEYRRVVGGAVEVLINRGNVQAADLEFDKKQEEQKSSYIEFGGLLRDKKKLTENPVTFLYPNQPNMQVVIWIDPRGKAGLFKEQHAPTAEVQQLLDAGYIVAGIDLLGQGEFLEQPNAIPKNRKVNTDREFAGFTYGYNLPLFAQRVNDVLNLITFAKNHKDQPQKIHLVGLSGAGHWVACAGALSGAEIDRVAIDTNGFRFTELTAFDDADFLPGAVKYGDLPALAALCAPHSLWVAGEKEIPAVTKAVYAGSGAAEKVTVYSGEKNAAGQAAVKWLMK